MNGYAVVSSVRLTELPQSYSWASVNCLPRRINLITLYRKGTTFPGGIGIFVTPALVSKSNN